MRTLQQLHRSGLSPSRIILGAAVALLMMALVLHVLWLLRWDWSLMTFFFHYPSTLFFLAMSFLTFVLCLAAWNQFSPGQSLRSAWLLISISAALNLLGAVFAHLLGTDTPLNPLLHVAIQGRENLISDMRQVGLEIGGPGWMLILALGLFLVLRTYHRLGLLSKLKAFDQGLLAVVFAYSCHVAYVVYHLQIHSSQSATFTQILSWFGDPLLCVLLFESILIRRAVVDMGWGFVGKCWGAFVAAIFLTSLGSMGQWAAAFGYLRWPENGAGWYVWYLSSAALALGPAFQVEAAFTARQRIEEALKMGDKVTEEEGLVVA